MKRQGWLVGMSVLAIAMIALPSGAHAQNEDVEVQNVSIPLNPDGGPISSPIVSVPIPDPAGTEYQGRFLSPKCEPGSGRGGYGYGGCRSCEQCERASGNCLSRCCLTKSIYNLLPCPCLKKSEGCACPPHFFCPRGHCRVRPTECARLDYRPYKTVMEPKKMTAIEVADYTKTKASQPVEVTLYPVYEPCCQDFWLEDDLVYADDPPCCLDDECQP